MKFPLAFRAVLCCTLSSLVFSPALSSQESSFSSLHGNLDALESLIVDTLEQSEVLTAQ
jgi:hypothetical protein